MEVTLDSIRDIRLYQSRTGYRFSVDALLLSDFVDLKVVGTIADLGAGSGIVGILLAKRYPGATVTLFEIQKGPAALAERNVILNGLLGRVRVVRADITELSCLNSSGKRYDLVVTNPPFRKWRSGRINLDEERAIARHEIKLSLPDLVNTVSYLLKPKGRFCVIYHPNRLVELMDSLREKGLEPKRLRFVHSNMASEAKMVLLEAVRGGKAGLEVERPFCIYAEDGRYSEEMETIYNQ
ncbi:MAG: tRNA1(Val) (adenine(37)-N6)-methyltransferase [Nitrospirota bacterium]